MLNGQRLTCPRTPATQRAPRARSLLLLSLCGAFAAQLAAAPPCRAADGGTDGGADGGDMAKAADMQVNLNNAAYQGGGIGCSSTGRGSDFGAAAALPLALLGLAALSRRRRRALLPVLVATTGVCATAHADVAIDAIHFRPSLLPGGILAVDGSQTLQRLGASGSALFSYGNNPLQLGGTPSGLSGGVNGQALMHMGLSVGLTSAVTAGIDLPVMLWQGVGDDIVERQLRTPASTAPVNPTATAIATSSGGSDIRLPGTGGVGDLRIFFKVRLKDNRDGGLGIAVMPLITAPTGDSNAYLGWGVASVEGRLIMDYRFGDKVLLAANGSFFSHGSTKAVNLNLSHELRYGLGVLYAITDSVSSFIEVFGRIGLSDRDGGVGVTVENSPAEGLLGLRYRHETGVTMQAGAGLGLNQGYGAPGARVFVGVGYTPFGDRAGATLPHLNKDGEEEEGSATPGTGKVPAETPPVLQTPPVVQTPPVEAPPVVQTPPVEAPPVVQTPPVIQTPPPVVQTPPPPVVQTPPPPVIQTPPVVQAPPVQQPAPVAQQAGSAQGVARIVGWRILVTEPVAFVPGFAVLLERSDSVLRDVAKLLQDRPDLKVTVEGHVDEPNLSAARQKTLSRERAEAVAKRLVKAGVPRARIATAGYGAERLLDQSGTAEAHERNTRLEFVLRE